MLAGRISCTYYIYFKTVEAALCSPRNNLCRRNAYLDNLAL